MSSTPAAPQPGVPEPGERIARLRLIRTENVGPMTFRLLLDRYGTAVRAVDALPELARRAGRRRALRVPPAAAVEREIEANRRVGADLLVVGDPGYPPRLAAIDDAPACFSVRGRIDLLTAPAVAVVGARNASVNGIRLAEFLAARIGAAGYCVVSGLARGIDRAAHLGALPTGTVAVLAGGIDVVYPPEHADLQDRVARHGALVAESPIETTPQARHFPSRNRIIAGLALGVLVVEAARRSGSLITARRALDQGREVFAVPGSPVDPRCVGANALIQEGAAHLVQTPDDVLGVLGGLAPDSPPPAPPMQLADSDAIAVSESQRRQVVDLLGPTPVPVDELIRRCQLSASAVATVILEAELAGVIDRYPGNLVARRIGTVA